ncbi:MAG TPA: ATP-dependent DNA ligase, partial [Gemmatimonadaceae bacterium]|nr:ATP-dependent DNA ligase [Gemmatimonadaceae bacterium]
AAMKAFARLFSEIDSTTRTTEKVDAMRRYFTGADPADAAWAVYFLSGGRPKRLVPVRRLATWAMEESGVPEWLFEESYHAVGDLAETIALLLPETTGTAETPLHTWVEERLLSIGGADEAEQQRIVIDAWRTIGGIERFVWTKLITGGFRVGVSQSLLVRGLSHASGIPESTIAHRMTGEWKPTADSYLQLIAEGNEAPAVSNPYPFFLAYPLEAELEELGPLTDWQVEWKWDGIRSQLIRRANASYLWSRGDELITERFPEVIAASESLPDGTVIDGEILPWTDGRPLPFAQLQRRIGRKNLSVKIRTEVPVVLLAYDLLELDGEDLRQRPLLERRELLSSLVRDANSQSAILLSPIVQAASWDDIRTAKTRARAIGSEGLMLKRLDASYGVGRRKGGWWKWKLEPYSVDAVMVYAQPGHGRRALLHTDYTFAVRDGDELIPFAKAYSGLTDVEIRELDSWIRRNTVEKFGPVRSVKPEQVFELGFEGIQTSPRHKSGIAVRFPRILRWRKDKRAGDADTIDTLRSILASAGITGTQLPGSGER